MMPFTFASAAFERALSDIGDARYFHESGEIRASFGLLVSAYVTLREHRKAVENELERLAAKGISSGFVQYVTARTHRKVHSSVHEALVDLELWFYVALPLNQGWSQEQRDSAMERLLAEWPDFLEFSVSEFTARLKSERASWALQYANINLEPPKDEVKGATVKQRYAADFLKDPDAIVALSAKNAAAKYDCSKTAIMETETWKSVMKIREMRRMGRADREKYKRR